MWTDCGGDTGSPAEHVPWRGQLTNIHSCFAFQWRWLETPADAGIFCGRLFSFWTKRGRQGDLTLTIVTAEVLQRLSAWIAPQLIAQIKREKDRRALELAEAHPKELGVSPGKNSQSPLNPNRKCSGESLAMRTMALGEKQKSGYITLLIEHAARSF